MQKPHKVFAAIDAGPFSEFGSVVATALTSALFEINKLGEDGKVKIENNQFHEMALKADLLAEKSMVGIIEAHFSYRAQVIWSSEELGDLTFGSNPKLQYRVLADGIDGTDNYKIKKKRWSYGSILSVAEGDDPIYDNFVASGVNLPELGLVLVADKYCKAVFMISIATGKIEELPRFDQDLEFDGSRVLSDPFRPSAKKLIGDRVEKWPRTGSTANSYFLLAVQNYCALVETTRKGNLEIPVGYLFMTLLGGQMVDINGDSIGPYKFNEWGQKKSDGKEDNQPLISSTNQNFIDGVLSDLNS